MRSKSRTGRGTANRLAFRRPSPSPAMAVALLALVLSLAGTSYAVISLPAGSVGTKQLRSGAVTRAKVKTGVIPPSRIASVHLDAPVTIGVPGYHMLATMHVAAGSYAIFAKAWATNTDASGVRIRCAMFAGHDSDGLRTDLGPGGVLGSTAAIMLTVVHRFPGAATISLGCDTSGTTVDFHDLKITAIATGALSSTGLVPGM